MQASGQFSQPDFGQVDAELLNGVICHVYFFVSGLKYSPFSRVGLVKDETVESLVSNVAEHLHRWCGVLLLRVLDRPSTVALKWRPNGEVTEWKAGRLRRAGNERWSGVVPASAAAAKGGG